MHSQQVTDAKPKEPQGAGFSRKPEQFTKLPEFSSSKWHLLGTGIKSDPKIYWMSSSDSGSVICDTHTNFVFKKKIKCCFLRLSQPKQTL